MTKDEIIAELMEQLRGARNEIKSLRELLEQYILKSNNDKEELRKAQKQAKGISRMLEKDNEKQEPQLTDEEKKKQEEARAIQCKARGNNNAKRDTHPEVRVEYEDVYPDDPDFDINIARVYEKMKEDGTPDYRISVRYKYVPGYFVKTIYRIRKYSQNGKIYEGKTPGAAFFNSNYDASFVAGLMQLRNIYGMPVERIIHYFEDMGFNLHKSTADFLLRKSAEVFLNFYKAIQQAVLGNDYIAADETYYKILVPEKNSKGKGVSKDYFWVLLGIKSGLVYVVYENGSRAGDVIYKQIVGFKGTLQSDAARFYKTIEGDKFPNIIRIPCLQHIKRKFIECKDAEPDAEKMVKLINRLYHEEHKHTIDGKEWTTDDNFRWRQQYAPDILAEIREHLDYILHKPDLLPKSELASAADYMDKEWSAIVDIFKRGDTYLDNNHVELLNRYFSISRRSSLFFGSHKGAERSAVLYTLALSAKLHKINFFDYITDILNKTANWQPNTSLDKYRNLLPDKWMKE